MSLVINTNTAATLASNNLAASNQLLQRSLNRLSSGSKIVSPADDAGGLAVSMKLTAAARRQAAALNNISSSVSYLQTQDGALKVVGKVLDRISELKTLSTDPTKSSSDIANYNTEFSALKAQLTSLGAETFNGVALFGSSTLDVSTTESGGGVINAGGIDLLGGGGAPAWSNITGSSPGSGWTASNPGIMDFGTDTAFHADGTLTTTQSNISGPFTMNFTFEADYAGSGNIRLSAGGADLDFTSIPGATDFSPHTMAITVAANGDATWSMDGGAETGAIAGFSSGGGSAIVFSVTNTGGGNDLHVFSDFTLTSSGGGGTGNIADVANAASLSALGLSTVTGAIQDLATHRAENGAQQSRLGFASEVLVTNKTNLEAANSRIVDVDVAAESTQLARYNILVQAGTSMLAQANQSQQAILKLLG